MKEIIRSVVIWAVLIAVLSAAAVSGAANSTDMTHRTGTVESVNAVSYDGDGCITVLSASSGEIRRMSAEEYAVFAVMGEIPFLLDEEALKAQVCAARTYAVRRIIEGEDENAGAHISDDPEKFQTCLTEAEARAAYGDEYETVFAAVTKATEETQGEIILYGNTPAVAAFHISSAGITESAENVWGKDIPYLTAVSSAENSPYTEVQRTFTYAEISARMTAEYGDVSVFDGIELRQVSPSGTVLSASLCGIDITGDRLARILTLNSAAFTVRCDENTVTFTVNGCGHLAGMSIYGAQYMAENGSDYRDILAHYYPGTEVSALL